MDRRPIGADSPLVRPVAICDTGMGISRTGLRGMLPTIWERGQFTQPWEIHSPSSMPDPRPPTSGGMYGEHHQGILNSFITMNHPGVPGLLLAEAAVSKNKFVGVALL